MTSSSKSENILNLAIYIGKLSLNLWIWVVPPSHITIENIKWGAQPTYPILYNHIL
jgi:hypothetical protein